MALARNTQRPDVLGSPGLGVEQLGALQERPPAANPTDDQYPAIAKQGGGVAATTLVQSCDHPEALGVRVEDFNGIEVVAIVTTDQDYAALGKSGSSVIDACVRHRSYSPDARSRQIDQLRGREAATTGSHSTGNQQLARS